ncbi:MAG TPA: hypothetical protein VFA12_14075 [Stellaceae bacterium]|nr:hypothetical protein [Stellaceae bacterium]
MAAPTPDYPNIVPPNNLRLPDALTIKHGPTQLLARFALEGDKAARDMGIELRLRHDFDELAYFNRQQVALDTWYPLVDMFNYERVEMTPENAFWISGQTKDGEIVVTWGARVYNWTGTSLKEQACAMWYGRDEGQRCIVTADAASVVSGVAICGGASWVRPDFRRRHLSRLAPRMGKAYAFSRWPIDWSFCYVMRHHVEMGLAAAYGQKHLSYSVIYPDSHLGELVLAYTSGADILSELSEFLRTDLLGEEGFAAEIAPAPETLEHSVMSTSSEGVFHGSSSRS